MKISERLTVVAYAFAAVLAGTGCAHRPPAARSTFATTTASTQRTLDPHDDLIVEMLAHFDFGDGVTLADMTDEEFEDFMKAGDRMPGNLGDATPPTRAEFLMRQARRRALEEASTPTTAPTNSFRKK